MFFIDIFRNLSNKKRHTKSDEVLTKKLLSLEKDDGHFLACNTTRGSGDGKCSVFKSQKLKDLESSKQSEVIRQDFSGKENEVANVRDEYKLVKSSPKNLPDIVENVVQHQPVTNCGFSQHLPVKDTNRNDLERIIEEISENSNYQEWSDRDGSTDGSEVSGENELERGPMESEENEKYIKELKTHRPIMELTKRYDIMLMPADVAKSRFEKENTKIHIILEEDELQLIAVEKRQEEPNLMSLQLKEGLEISKQKDNEICSLKSENQRLYSNLSKISDELLSRFKERAELLEKQTELTKEKDELKNKLLNVMQNCLEGTNMLKITNGQPIDLVERITKIEKDIQLKLAKNCQQVICMYQHTDLHHSYLEKNEDFLDNKANSSNSQKYIKKIFELKKNKDIMDPNINAIIDKYNRDNQTLSEDLLADKSNYDGTKSCLTKLEKENKYLKSNIEKLENDISVLKKQLEDMKLQNESFETESRSQQIEASKLENKAKMLEIKLDEVSCKYKQQKEQILTEFSTKIDTLKKELDKKEKENYDLTKANNELIKENCELDERAKKISDLEVARKKSLNLNVEKLMIEMEKMYDLKIKLFYAKLEDISEKLSFAEKNLQDTALKHKKYDKLSIENKRLTLEINGLNQTANELKENILKLRPENNVLNESVVGYKNKFAAYFKPYSPNAGSQMVSCPNVRIRQTLCHEQLLRYTCGSDNCTCIVELPQMETKCDCAANLLGKDLHIKELTQKLDQKRLFIEETLNDLQKERNLKENMKLRCKEKIDNYKIKKKYWEKHWEKSISDMIRGLLKSRSQVEVLNKSIKMKDEELEKLKNENFERNVTTLKMKQNKKSISTLEPNAIKAETTTTPLISGRSIESTLNGGRLMAGTEALPVSYLDRLKGQPAGSEKKMKKHGQRRGKRRMPAPNAYSPGPTLKFPTAPKFTIAGLIPNRADIPYYTAADRVSGWDD